MPATLRSVALAIFAALLASVAVAGPDEARAVLVPTGTLRVGVYPGSPTSLLRDPASGEARGVAVDLGTDLARELGVPMALVAFRRPAEVVAAVGGATADFTLTNASAARAEVVAFTGPVIVLESGFLVASGSRVANAAELDRAGVRVGVTEGGSSSRTMAGILKSATIVPVASLSRAAEMLRAGELDAYATNKSVLFQMADGMPGARVLEGSWGAEHLAVAIPKGREAALAYLEAFIAKERGSGALRRAQERAGLRGLAPNP